MQIQYGFDNGQAQAEAVVVGFAGLIPFVKADEDILQLFRGKGRAGVGDGDVVNVGGSGLNV